MTGAVVQDRSNRANVRHSHEPQLPDRVVALIDLRVEVLDERSHGCHGLPPRLDACCIGGSHGDDAVATLELKRDVIPLLFREVDTDLGSTTVMCIHVDAAASVASPLVEINLFHGSL